MRNFKRKLAGFLAGIMALTAVPVQVLGNEAEGSYLDISPFNVTAVDLTANPTSVTAGATGTITFTAAATGGNFTAAPVITQYGATSPTITNAWDVEPLNQVTFTLPIPATAGNLAPVVTYTPAGEGATAIPSTGGAVTVNAPAVTAVGLTANPTTVVAGATGTITFTAVATGGNFTAAPVITQYGATAPTVTNAWNVEPLNQVTFTLPIPATAGNLAPVVTYTPAAGGAPIVSSGGAVTVTPLEELPPQLTQAQTVFNAFNTANTPTAALPQLPFTAVPTGALAMAGALNHINTQVLVGIHAGQDIAPVVASQTVGTAAPVYVAAVAGHPGVSSVAFHITLTLPQVGATPAQTINLGLQTIYFNALTATQWTGGAAATRTPARGQVPANTAFAHPGVTLPWGDVANLTQVQRAGLHSSVRYVQHGTSFYVEIPDIQLNAFNYLLTQGNLQFQLELENAVWHMAPASLRPTGVAYPEFANNTFRHNTTTGAPAWSIQNIGDTRATVTIYPGFVTTEYWVARGAHRDIRIPMLVRTTGTADARARVVDVTQRGGFNIARGWQVLSQYHTAGRTNTVATDIGTHRHTLNFNLAITETFLGAFGGPAQGVRAFDLIAPSGFSWAVRNGGVSGTNGNLATGVGNPSFSFSRFNNNNVLRVELTGLVATTQGGLLGQIVLSDLVLQANNWEQAQDQEVYITIRDAQQRTGTVPGGSGNFASVGNTIVSVAQGTGNLVFNANLNGQWVELTNNPNTFVQFVQGGGQSYTRRGNFTPVQTQGVTQNVPGLTNPFVSEQRINVGTIADWAVRMTTVGETVPELLSGRLYHPALVAGANEQHRTVRVRVEENMPHAAHEDRTLTFSLPEGITIREARFLNVNNIANSAVLTTGTVEGQQVGSGRHFNLNNADNRHVRINNNELHLTNLTRQGNNNEMSFEMYLYLSIEAGFEGNIDLALGGSAARNEADTPYVVIAEAISPITVTAQTTNIRVGYQFIPVGNFTITENRAGALLPNEEVFITITDGVFAELQIAPGFNWNVTEGNIDIRNMQVANQLTGLWQGSAMPNVSFEVQTASSTPSVIEFTNVQVRAAAVVPASNVGYDLIVWGPAVAMNFNHPLVTQGGYPTVAGSQNVNVLNRNAYGNFVNARDLFNTAGFSTPFITAGTEGANIVNQPVSFSEDGVVTVGGTVQNFPAEQWGSFEINESGVSVLPARMAFAVLFGGNYDPYDPQMFVWNAAESMFLIDQQGRDIRFQVNNQAMWVDGVQRTILSGEGAAAFPYAPYVNPANQRMMLPVRAFADALGLTVSWDAATATVTLTPPGYVAE